MGQIVGLKAKPKRCNLNKLSQLGIPDAGEYILVSYDNSMTANGQGNFDRYIMGDGRTAATALELKYLDDSTRPYIVEEVNKAVADIQPIEITGDVTNAPDEEDLTSENQGGTDVLKFKDKAYNSALYSGLGRTYLRKNIVTLEGTGKNVLTQAMVNTANTIYHIQYDYDLNGQTLTIPEGCTLEFEGGSIKNGTITGNYTHIESGLYHIFKDNITISGTWETYEVYPEWFGAKGDGTTDDSSAIQKVIDSFKGENIALQAKTYKVANTISYSNTDGNTSIALKITGKGSRNTIIKGTSSIVLSFGAATDMVLRDFRITGNTNNIGIKLGTSVALPAVRCLIENISIYSCQTGIIVYGWLNQFNSLQVRFNTVGIENHSTQATFVNIIAEGNHSCGIQTSGEALFSGGTIEANGQSGLFSGIINNGNAILQGVYFEGNGPTDSDATNIDSITGKHNVGSHIKCGFTEEKTAARLIVNSCNFSAGNYSKQRNAIDLDKCSYAVIESSTETEITTTNNTGVVRKHPHIIEYNNLNIFSNTNTAISRDTVLDIAPNPIFEISSWANLSRSTDSMYPLSSYYEFYPVTNDGEIAIQTTSGSAKSIIYANDDKKVTLIAGGNNSNVEFSIFVGWGLIQKLYQKGVKKITASICFKGNRTVSNAYTTYLNTAFTGYVDGQTKRKDFGSKTNTIDYSIRDSGTLYMTISLDEIMVFLEDYETISGGGAFYTLQFRSSRVPSNEEATEYQNAHFDIFNICLYPDSVADYKSFIKQGIVKEYQDMGNIVPNSITLPDEAAIKPKTNALVIYNDGDFLSLENSQKKDRVQKIVTSQPSNPVVGMSMFNTTYGIELWYNGTKWVDSDGYTGTRKRGSSAQMPTNLDNTDAGFSYFNTDLMDSLIWDGNFFNIVLGNYMYKKYVELTPGKEVISWASSFKLNTRDVSYCDNAIVSVKAGTIISVRGHCSQFGTLLSLVTTLADENDKHSVIQKYGNAQTNGIVVTAKPDKYIISAPEDCILVVNVLNSSYTTPYGNTNNTPYEIILCSNTPFLESE